MAPLEQRMIEIHDAVLEVFVGGTSDPAVCNGHPLNSVSEQGNEVSNALLDTCTVVLINPRGIGKSSPAPTPLNMLYRQLADDTDVIRQRLEVTRFVYAGDSGAAVVALLYALRHPQALAGLILGFCFASVPHVLADAESLFSPLHPRNQALIATAPVASLPAPGRTIHWVQLRDGSWFGLRENQPYVVWPWDTMSDGLQAAWEEFTGFDVRDRLGAIQVPTLVVAGQQDDFIPRRHSELVAQSIPNAELVILEHSSHWVADEDRQQYRDAVQQFIIEHVGT